MAEAYGLYTHIRANRMRSVALLVGLFFLVYVLLFAGALVAEGLSVNAPLHWLLARAWQDFLAGAPWATAGTIDLGSFRLSVPSGTDRCRHRRT